MSKLKVALHNYNYLISNPTERKCDYQDKMNNCKRVLGHRVSALLAYH